MFLKFLAKDEEIKDYKSNGATLVRQTLETKPFSSFVLEPVPTPGKFRNISSLIDLISMMIRKQTSLVSQYLH